MISACLIPSIDAFFILPAYWADTNASRIYAQNTNRIVEFIVLILSIMKGTFCFS